MLDRVYLDHNATTPVRPEVLEAMLPFLGKRAGNPSSLHAWGGEARDGVEAARTYIAEGLGCSPEEVYFTSGGTEADNWAIVGGAQSRSGGILTTSLEHPAVLEACRFLAEQGREVFYLPADRRGSADLAALESYLANPLALVSVMHANNETGVIQPVAAMGSLIRARGGLFHIDAVQSFGKIPVRVDELGADLVSLSAHKINGPKGIGALYIRRGTEIMPRFFGGAQEGGLRAGTENVPGVVGFGRAAQIALGQMEQNRAEWARLRQDLEEGIKARIEKVEINGKCPRLSNTANLSFRGVEAEGIVLGLDLEGIAVSSGSACSAATPEPSHVLLAMGLEPRLAAASVRFSVGWGNSAEEIDRVLEVLPPIVERLRRLSMF